jgi:A118 family predicted phage portal protein
MPLPVGGKTYKFPPEDSDNTYGEFREHAAWYSGDVQELASVYVGMGAPGAKPHGLVNVVRSWFWGKQAIATATRIRIHVPFAAEVSTTNADLLFARPPLFLIKDEDAHEDIQDRLDEIVEQEAFSSLLFEAGEISSALGGVYLRMTWDEDVAPDRPLLTCVHPDSAVPTFRFGRLVAVTFWHIVETTVNSDGGGSGFVYRHLERHEPGMIYHGCYRGTKEFLGTPCPLTECEATADLAEDVNEDGAIPTNITRLTAVYVPNMRPNRVHRDSGLGRSDYAGSEGLMDAIDETITSLMRDVRLGRGRIIVPADFVRTMPNSKGQGGWFDVDQEVFMPLPGMNPATESSITISQFAIRAKEHQDVAMVLLERAVASMGYSASTFGFMGDASVQTATEIVSRERRSFVTRNKKIQYWTPALRDFLMAVLEFDKVRFKGAGVAPITVKFPEAVTEDPFKRSGSIELLARAGAASIARLVAMSDDTLTDDEIAKEVKAIMKERGMLVPDPTKASPTMTVAGMPGEPTPAPPGAVPVVSSTKPATKPVAAK